MDNNNQSSASHEVVDEIKQYVDCEYKSPSEAWWRIFSFPIHERNPAIERLFFHFPGEQSVYFKDDDCIDDILGKATVVESMFTSWMECNKTHEVARRLTYPLFVSKFVYVKKDRC